MHSFGRQSSHCRRRPTPHIFGHVCVCRRLRPLKFEKIVRPERKGDKVVRTENRNCLTVPSSSSSFTTEPPNHRTTDHCVYDFLCYCPVRMHKRLYPFVSCGTRYTIVPPLFIRQAQRTPNYIHSTFRYAAISRNNHNHARPAVLRRQCPDEINKCPAARASAIRML